MSVTGALFRVYRPIVIPFAIILVAGEVIATAIVAGFKDLDFSMWLVLGGQAAKYWLLVVGIMLVARQLRQFVVNGVTRHEFLAGVGVFGLVLALGWAVAVVLGHQVESLLLEAFDARGAGYPVLTLGGAVRELGSALPSTVAWLVTGVTIAAGFYRFRPWTGLAVMVFGAAPAAVAEGLLGYNESGGMAHLMPYPAALAVSLATTAVVARGCHRLISDVPIRPPAAT